MRYVFGPLTILTGHLKCHQKLFCVIAQHILYFVHACHAKVSTIETLESVTLRNLLRTVLPTLLKLHCVYQRRNL